MVAPLNNILIQEQEVQSEKILLGTEDGMFCLDTNKDEVMQVDAKRQIHAIIRVEKIKEKCRQCEEKKIVREF